MGRVESWVDASDLLSTRLRSNNNNNNNDNTKENVYGAATMAVPLL